MHGRAVQWHQKKDFYKLYLFPNKTLAWDLPSLKLAFSTLKINVGKCISFWDRLFSKAMLVSESVWRLQICPLYIFGNKATDGTYRSKYWFPGFGFDSFAKATALCSYRISFCLCVRNGRRKFSTSLAKPRFVALLSVSSARVPTFDWTSLGFGKGKHMKYDQISSTILLQKLHGKNNLSKTQWFLQLCRRQIFEKDWQHVCYGHPSRWTQVVESNDHHFVKMISKMSTQTLTPVGCYGFITS